MNCVGFGQWLRYWTAKSSLALGRGLGESSGDITRELEKKFGLSGPIPDLHFGKISLDISVSTEDDF